jgi:multicomponent Na+:H+ antiporter subunit D
MTIADINPGFVLILAGVLALVTPMGFLRGLLAVAAPAFALSLIFGPGELGVHGAFNVLGHTLTLHRFDALALPFAAAFSLGALLAGIYSLDRTTRGHVAPALIHAGGAIAAVLSGDIISFLLFAEVSALAAAALIWNGGGRLASHAAFRYLTIQVFAGSLILAGGAALAVGNASPTFEQLDIASPAGALILAGLLIKAGAPGVHFWIRDAYPRATPEGAVYLSMFTTKLAIYGLLRAFPGEPLLVWIGLAAAIWPLFFAVVEDDLRRVACYGLIAQNGLMMAAVGMGGPIPVGGAMTLAFAGVLYMGLAFMVFGAVDHRVGHARISGLGSLWRTMPLTTTFGLIAGLSIAAAPLSSGYLGKSMALSTLSQDGLELVWLAFMVASTAAALIIGIRAPVRAFFSRRPGSEPPEAPFNMILAMTITAFVSIASGFVPGFLLAMLPEGIDYPVFTWAGVSGQVQVIAFAALAFAILDWMRVDPRPRGGIARDVDDFYRGPMKVSLRWAARTFQRIVDRIIALAGQQGNKMRIAFMASLRPDGNVTRFIEAPSAIWVTAALIALLVIGYIVG